MKFLTKIGITSQKTTDSFGFQLFLENHRKIKCNQKRVYVPLFEKKAYHCK